MMDNVSVTYLGVFEAEVCHHIAGGCTDTTGRQRKKPNRYSFRCRGGRADASKTVVGKDVTGEYLLRLVGKSDKDRETQSWLNGI